MLGFGQAGHKHHRNVLGGKVGFQLAGHFKAIQARHDGVEQNHVGQRQAGAAERGFAVGGHQHGVAGFVQRVVEQGKILWEVVHHQNNFFASAVIQGHAGQSFPDRGAAWLSARPAGNGGHAHWQHG